MKKEKTIKCAGKHQKLFLEYLQIRDKFPDLSRRQAYMMIAERYVIADTTMQRILIKYGDYGDKKYNKRASKLDCAAVADGDGAEACAVQG